MITELYKREQKYIALELELLNQQGTRDQEVVVFVICGFHISKRWSHLQICLAD